MSLFFPGQSICALNSNASPKMCFHLEPHMLTNIMFLGFLKIRFSIFSLYSSANMYFAVCHPSNQIYILKETM
jgi:hypothetical protein